MRASSHGICRYATLPVLALLLSYSPLAQAEVTTLHAYESEEPTTFTLDFFDLGITSTSKVVATRFTLEIDDQTNTARFTDYYQIVEPLMLPLGISTGYIEVRIVSSEGIYDSSARAFQTNDEYEISFTNDLSAFGFTSPVVIPSTSRASMDGDVATARSVGMTWQGQGQLENTENPEQPYKYEYTCESRTQIANADTIPPLPLIPAFSNQVCGNGVCGVTGLGSMMLLFAGMGAMKAGHRSRRQRQAR